ncbi:MAG: hypothetical protein ACFNUU_08560 [Campylobacter sp.]|uniref:hypothetical protein n=1 Tax=Campylobacter sp. TaxID=205 RepID=UPI00360B5756
MFLIPRISKADLYERKRKRSLHPPKVPTAYGTLLKFTSQTGKAGLLHGLKFKLLRSNLTALSPGESNLSVKASFAQPNPQSSRSNLARISSYALNLPSVEPSNSAF